MTAGNDSDIASVEQPVRLRVRLADRSKAPRCWWYPLPVIVKGDPETLVSVHEKCSETVRRAMLALLGVALFCLVTALGTQDSALIGVAEASVIVPFANVPISFVGFLVVAPFLLIVLSIYLHVFFGHLITLGPALSSSAGTLPTLFNIDHPMAGKLAHFIFYSLVPLVFLAITWKAASRFEWSLPMTIVTAIVSSAFLYLRIRRCPETTRSENRKRWISLLIFISLLFGLIGTGVLGSWPESWPLQRVLTLERSDFTRKRLPYVQLQHANLNESILNEAYLQRANLNRATLVAASLVGTNLTEANLRRADLSGANLSDANLSEASLIRANLFNANLSGTILDKADLSRANLSDANLSEASLIGARLRDANLRGAELRKANLGEGDLRGANLRGANLRGANLRWANLRWAKLGDANLDQADLSGADLSRAVNLTQNQLAQACGDGRTQLSKALEGVKLKACLSQ